MKKTITTLVLAAMACALIAAPASASESAPASAPASASAPTSAPAPASAPAPESASAPTSDGSHHAETLSRLGLFLGTDGGFELERAATRAESAVMAVRLLGKEGEALRSNYGHPFSDVPEWASAHVGYLFHGNIAKGVSDDLFGSDEVATSEQYGTFVLRALGYDDSLGDFSWDRSLDKMASLGIITSEQASGFASLPGVLRGDAVAISYFSMFANLKGGNTTLLEKLYMADKAITFDQMKAASAIDERLSMFSGAYGVGRSHPEGDALTSEQVFGKASAAVFKINMALSDLDAGSGSGFFISSDGLAVTNKHVLMYMSSASVTTADGRTHPVEGVLALHADSDIAVIKVKGSGFSYLEVGDPAALRAAQRIYCLGSPYGLDNTISDGLVSNLRRMIDGSAYIQISAPIAPGSSGGALLNEYAQVVGVTTAGIGIGGEVNLATPITELATAYRFGDVRSFLYLQAHSHFGSLPIGDTYREAGDNGRAPAQTMKNDTIMLGAISGADDVDHYSLDVRGTAEMLVSLTTDMAHSGRIVFEVSDPQGEAIMKSRHYEGEAFSLAIGLGATKGKYTVKVYVDERGDGGGGGGGSGSGDWDEVGYELYWIYHRAYQDTGSESIFFEFEPNDTPEYANYLPDFSTYISSISSKSDVDYYSFTLADDYAYVAFINTVIDSEALDVEVFDADGESVGRFEEHEGLGVLAFEGELPAGTYFIKVAAKDKGMRWDNELYTISGGWLDLDDEEQVQELEEELGLALELGLELR